MYGYRPCKDIGSTWEIYNPYGEVVLETNDSEQKVKDLVERLNRQWPPKDGGFVVNES